MKVLDRVRVIIYRCHEKGLEVFLLNPTNEKEAELSKIPYGSLDGELQGIHLEPWTNENGEVVKTYAIEGDYHDIPSIRALLKYDVQRFKSKVKQVLPCLEQGSFVEIKDVLRRVMPNEYAALKELKEIIKERNTVINI